MALPEALTAIDSGPGICTPMGEMVLGVVQVPLVVPRAAARMVLLEELGFPADQHKAAAPLGLAAKMTCVGDWSLAETVTGVPQLLSITLPLTTWTGWAVVL